MRRIEIRDSDREGGFLAFDLAHVLSALSNTGPHLHWCVVEWEGRLLPDTKGPPVWLRELTEDTIVETTWPELTLFASDVFQTDDAMLIGFAGMQPGPELPIVPDEYHDFVLIEGIDNSFWAVTSDLPEVIETIQRTFQNTLVVPTSRFWE